MTLIALSDVAKFQVEEKEVGPPGLEPGTKGL